MECSFVMIKPDGVKRRLMGRIISRFEDKGLRIIACKMMKVEKKVLLQHYAALSNKPFFESLISYVSDGDVLAMVVAGGNAVSVCRKVIGATDPLDSAAGTIRGDFGLNKGRNLIHGSDSIEAAKSEIKLWFGEVEVGKGFDDELIYE